MMWSIFANELPPERRRVTSDRRSAILFTSEMSKVLFINVCMPYDTGICDETRADVFSDVLNDISRLIESVGVTSSIDHFLVSERVYNLALNVQVAHSGANLSDHEPLLL